MSDHARFKEAYLKLNSESDRKFSMHLYHYNDNSEPFLSSESDVEKVVLDRVGGHGLIITIITPEILLSFSEASYMARLDDEYVTFGSRFDEETHCIIEFC